MSSYARQYLYLVGADSKQQVLGEATEDEFEDQIQFTSWNWSMKRDTSSDAEATRGRGAKVGAVPTTFNFAKIMDKSSTQMLNRMKAGEKLNAIITLASSSDARFQLVIKLKNVRVIEYRLDAEDAQGSSEIKEDWTLNYDEVTFEHVPEPPPGGRLETLTTVHKRSAQAETEKSETPAKKVLDGFGSMSKPEQVDTLKQMKNKFPGAFG